MSGVVSGPLAAVWALLLSGAAALAAPPLAGCDAFSESLRRNAADLKVDLQHSLVVSRAHSDAQVFDLTTNGEVDGTLTCRGDEFLRFEARIAEPAPARRIANFEAMLTAAVRSALGWDAEHAGATVHEMTADVREYIAASRQRGDVYISGKTEEHEPGGVSLGLIYTDTERALIIVGPNG